MYVDTMAFTTRATTVGGTIARFPVGRDAPSGAF
jgi:hypothetical protein